MYSLQQIVSHGNEVKIQLPTCMYKINNIHHHGNEVLPKVNSNIILNTTSGAQLQDSEDMEVMKLAERQKQLLSSIQFLKDQIEDIRKNLREQCNMEKPVEKPQKIKCEEQKVDVSKLFDVNLNVNPENPPYSLLLLQRLFKEQAHLNFLIHKHSNVKGSLPALAQKFSELPENTPKNPILPVWNIRLIWKSNPITDLEFSIDGHSVLGEVNFLRYIARTLGGLHFPEGDLEMQSLLDVAADITHSKTKTSRVLCFRKINKYLSKSPFIYSQLSIVDIALYSAIRQSASSSELGVNLAKWMMNCETF